MLEMTHMWAIAWLTAPFACLAPENLITEQENVMDTENSNTTEKPDYSKNIPEFNSYNCRGCGNCARQCHAGAIEIEKISFWTRRARIDPARCTACGRCLTACRRHCFS